MTDVRDRYPIPDQDLVETREWMDSFQALVQQKGPARARHMLSILLAEARRGGIPAPELLQTPYVNTIPSDREPPYPGDEGMELRIRRIIRWNAVMMVQRANHLHHGIGGHLATYASAATLYEVGFNHFFRGKDGAFPGDQVFMQGHASPGVYARAFLEGRISRERLDLFRRETGALSGLSSYPHPWLMPDFWEFPTVSMGLSPIAAIYQARFNRYLQGRGIKNTDDCNVWAFLGDGETDEPESLGALSMAAREKLDNLIFVVNCNLQRLDGPVRGNGKIIQELEAVFHGAGWDVIKVIWGRRWDPLLAEDKDGLLVQRMGEVVDGEYQKYSTEPTTDYIRKHFFGKYPELSKRVESMTDAQLWRLRRGGHDAQKVHAAYQRAVSRNGKPTVILAKTVKGWTLGQEIMAKNIAHGKKEMSDADLKHFRDELQLAIPDDRLHEFFLPDPKSPEVQYLLERRRALGGFVPHRKVVSKPLKTPSREQFKRFFEGSGDTAASTTSAFAQVLATLLRDKEIGKRIVPIIPDEARTFGLDVLFAQYGIYSSVGQLYEPVDKAMLLHYRESKDGQVLEEGITEAGSMASFTAAGTSYATHGEPMIPFYIFYSMFGLQRTGDQAWAFGDMRGRGFLLGATAGRTTLNGEGLQHQDGHSLLLASTLPTVRAYDPAFAFEIATILQDGLARMFQDGQDIFYYLTLQNESYPMPAMPKGVEDNILKGMYLFREGEPVRDGMRHVQLMGSGSILNEILKAQEILAEMDIRADVWSCPGWLQLRREALAVERWNMLHPDEPHRKSFIEQTLAGVQGPFIAATDYMKAVPDQIAPWVPGGLTTLGTDGFGRSDTRRALRRHFGVDYETITATAVGQLVRRGHCDARLFKDVLARFDLDPERPDAAIL